MAITRWQPFRELNSLQERMNRLFEDFLGERNQLEGSATGWAPAVDICEDSEKVVLKADLPGIDEKDISLDVDGNRLTLKGERRMEKETQEENYHRVERAYGQFVRAFTLPNTVDVENIKASFKNGVLEVSLPKKEEIKPKHISIAVE